MHIIFGSQECTTQHFPYDIKHFIQPVAFKPVGWDNTVLCHGHWSNCWGVPLHCLIASQRWCVEGNCSSVTMIRRRRRKYTLLILHLESSSAFDPSTKCIYSTAQHSTHMLTWGTRGATIIIIISVALCSSPSFSLSRSSVCCLSVRYNSWTVRLFAWTPRRLMKFRWAVSFLNSAGRSEATAVSKTAPTPSFLSLCLLLVTSHLCLISHCHLVVALSAPLVHTQPSWWGVPFWLFLLRLSLKKII